MVELVRSMTGDHPARPVLVASNDPAAAGLARAAELGVPTAAVDYRAFKGDREAGATVHLVTPVLDDGPILGQARVPVQPGDTAATLAARVLKAEHRLYPAALRRFAGGDASRLDL